MKLWQSLAKWYRTPDTTCYKVSRDGRLIIDLPCAIASGRYDRQFKALRTLRLSVKGNE